MKVQFEYFTFGEEVGETIKGEFKGIAIDPFPVALINDGTQWGVSLSHQLKEFLKATQIPVGTIIEIKFLGKGKTKDGNEFTKLEIQVDEKSLPKSYDKKLLQESIETDVMKVDWDAIEEMQKKRNE